MALAFVIGVFIFAPDTLPEYKHRVLAAVAAITTGLFAYFLSGEIGLDVQFGESRFGKTSVKATGGIAVFVFVLIWWFSPWAPVKREALEKVKKGTEEIKKDTGEIKSDISDLKNITTQLLEQFRRSHPVRIFQGRTEEGMVEKPSPRAHELAAKIPDDADPYSLALKAIAQGRNDDASRRPDEAQKTKEIELSKIYEAKGLAEKFAGRFSSSIDWFKKALVLSEDNPQVLHELGMSSSLLRKYPEAERHLRRALEVQQQAHSHRGGVASILHDLGLLCYFQEKYAEAESFYKRAQEAQSSEYALSPLLKLGYKTMTIRGLGQVYSKQRKYSEAEVHFLQAIDNFDDSVNLLGEGSNFCSSLFYIGWNLNDLADVYFLQARYSEALPHV
ncbi:MAG: tetratricopeptide repeat protein, partial [Gammaproteobacteria bacterium]